MDQDYKTYMKLENQLCFKLYAASRMVTSTYTLFETFRVDLHSVHCTLSSLGKRWNYCRKVVWKVIFG